MPSQPLSGKDFFPNDYFLERIQTTEQFCGFLFLLFERDVFVLFVAPQPLIDTLMWFAEVLFRFGQDIEN